MFVDFKCCCFQNIQQQQTFLIISVGNFHKTWTWIFEAKSIYVFYLCYKWFTQSVLVHLLRVFMVVHLIVWLYIISTSLVTIQLQSTERELLVSDQKEGEVALCFHTTITHCLINVIRMSTLMTNSLLSRYSSLWSLV